ncbi:MAG TPA: hypothetical protein VMT23_01585 [Candidatus Binatia bacterium]|nr:hypothetical protein [Candidatus Binatia bacterium]
MHIPEEDHERLAVGLWDRGIIGFVDEPGVTLNSGRLSPYYYNDRHILSINYRLDAEGVMSTVDQEKLRDLVIGRSAAKVLSLSQTVPGSDHMLGKAQAETGIGAAIAMRSGLSFLWERVTEPDKETSTIHQPIEGDFEPGETVLLAENCVTTGGEVTKGIKLAVKAGLQPVAVFAQFDRQEGGRGKIEDEYGLPFDSLTTLSSVTKYLLDNRRIGNSHVERLARYHEQLQAQGIETDFVAEA